MTTALSLILALMLSIGGSSAGGPGNTGIQATVDNSPNVSHFFEGYTPKTASRLFPKKIPEIVSIDQPKTQIRLIFTLPLKEKPLLMGYEDSMNLYQAFNMNPINFTDPFGLQEKEFQVMCMYPDNKLEDILIMQKAARRGYAKGALALGIGLVAATLSGPTIIAFVGSTLIYTGLDEYSERIKAGQSPYEAKTGTIVNKMTLGLYPIIKGEDPGTGDAIEAKERFLRGMDWLGQFIAGTSGYISGKLFFGMNPSTFQLTDEAFNKTTGQATYNLAEPYAIESINSADFQQWLTKGEKNVGNYIGHDPITGEPVYTGITNNFKVRQYQWRGVYDLQKINEGNLYRNQARCIEQVIKVKNPGFNNINNSINPNRAIYNEALNWGINWLKSMGFKL